MDNRREKGKISEELACEFLTRNGYKILDQNYHCSNKGELDIVALDVAANTIAIIEVKSRQNLEMGYPEEAVTQLKRTQIKRMAGLYVSIKGIKDTLIRYDVIAVLFRDGEEPEIIHMKDAFY